MSEIKRRPHTWDSEGEQCTLCGESEWIGTHCPGTAEERVHAAAPELLEALLWCKEQGWLKYAQRLPKQNAAFCDGVDRALAAIAKATGSQS